jgi:hypothetical protein
MSEEHRDFIGDWLDQNMLRLTLQALVKVVTKYHCHEDYWNVTLKLNSLLR